ncbi:MAG: hypothetical protein AB8I08_16245 [Sandaracinaceae bacterium]
MTRSTQTLLLLSALSLPLAACGSPARSTQTADNAAGNAAEDEEEDNDSYIDEEELEDDDDDAGFVDSTLLQTASAPMELAEAQLVPGTGVTLRPPEGSRAMPFGAGFLAMRQRVQLSVVVAEGGPEIVETMRTGGAPGAPEPEGVSEIEVSGATGRLGRDRVQSQAGALERYWLFVHDGDRGMGVIATYEGSRAPAVRAGVREVLESVTWDREAELDAAAALGIEIGEVEGLARARRSTANLVLVQPDAPFPPEAGQPVITLSPLPMQIPAAQRSAACEQLIARFVPAAEDAIILDRTIEEEGGTLPGCERLATAEAEGETSVLVYAALLFNGPLPIMVTASAEADAVDTWRPRFTGAARSVRMAEGAAVP